MAYFLAFCLLLAVVLTVGAWRRLDRRRRLLRIGAGWAAVAGLWLAAFPPTRSEEQPAVQTAVLLTDGYSPDTLRQLLRRAPSGTPVWRYTASAPDTPTLSNLPALRQRLPLLHTLHVLGQGLPPADAPSLRGLRVVAHLPPPRAGFRSAAWPRQPELGQPWAVEGYFEGNRAPVWISLRAAGAPRDSVRVPAGGGAFGLRFTPKAEGRALYTLVARSSDAGLIQEPVPLEVRPARPVRVLLLATAPSFEIRFLKNYLAAHQHTVAVRTGISRGLTQTEFLNLTTPPDLSKLTPALLTRFELVVADAGSLAALTGSEAGSLAQAVRAGRIGVLLLADAPTLPRSLPGAGSFQLVARPAATTPQLLSWPNAPSRLAAALPATLRSGPEVRPVVLAANQQLAVATRRVGLGQVAVTTLTETFPWVLQGQTAAYEAYWGHLLTALVPAMSASPSIQLKTNWPRPDMPVEVQVTGAPATALSLREGNTTTPVRVALRQDEYVPEWATAPYWPTAAGWHEAQAGAARQWFYVFGSTEWGGPARQEWLQTAATLAADAKPALESTSSTATPTAWPRWWGYLVFLLGAGLLWLEEKL